MGRAAPQHRGSARRARIDRAAVLAVVAAIGPAAGCDRAVVTCEDEVDRAPPSGAGGNVLVLVIDDVGVDKVGAYGVHPQPSPTPNLDGLLDAGVRFERAYASPTCSPTRASTLTGRHPSRHGIGKWIAPTHDLWGLPDNELTIAEVARDAGYATAAVGKWHLSVFDGHIAAADPQSQGFDTFHGILGNPDNAVFADDLSKGYWHWERDDDGILSYSSTYLTTAQIDDAIDQMATLPEPWFLYVAFSAAHVPLDRPPPSLSTPVSDEDPDLFDSVVEAFDKELGRMLGSMGELRDRTTIITFGDNGTPEHAIRPPFDPTHSKGTVTEGGIRVPFGVSGPFAVPGTTSSALVHVADVFATVADLAGVDVTTLRGPDRRGVLGPLRLDSLSLLPEIEAPGAAPHRRCMLVEQHNPGGRLGAHRDMEQRALVEDNRKLVRSLHDPDQMYVLDPDPSVEPAIGDGPDDVDDPGARERLGEEMAQYLRSFR